MSAGDGQIDLPRSLGVVYAQQRVAVLNERRFAEGVPTTDAYLGLHVGDVFYGNVGSKERLDFTVIGPAGNEVTRIAAICRSALAAC